MGKYAKSREVPSERQTMRCIKIQQAKSKRKKKKEKGREKDKKHKINPPVCVRQDKQTCNRPVYRSQLKIKATSNAAWSWVVWSIDQWAVVVIVIAVIKREIEYFEFGWLDMSVCLWSPASPLFIRSSQKLCPCYSPRQAQPRQWDVNPALIPRVLWNSFTYPPFHISHDNHLSAEEARKWKMENRIWRLKIWLGIPNWSESSSLRMIQELNRSTWSRPKPTSSWSRTHLSDDIKDWCMVEVPNVSLKFYAKVFILCWAGTLTSSKSTGPAR